MTLNRYQTVLKITKLYNYKEQMVSKLHFNKVICQKKKKMYAVVFSEC